MEKTLVIGLGLSGFAATKFLIGKGKSVVAFDDNPLQTKSERLQNLLDSDQITIIGDLQELNPIQIDQIIVSPGICKSHHIHLFAKKHNIPLIGEMELGFSYFEGLCIGITGTNGKSTLTKLIVHILNDNGKKAVAVGNIGYPLTSFLPRYDGEVIVAEISSAQLETMKQKKIDMGILLNITPDHLDRYDSFEEYRQIKLHLLDLIKPFGALYAKEEISDLCKQRSDIRYFWQSEGQLELTKDLEVPFSLQAISTACIAFAEQVAGEFGITRKAFIESLASFQMLGHRVEYVGEIDGIKCYNDSKSTTVASTIFAVDKIDGEIALLVGGMSKGQCFLEWRDKLSDRIVKVFAFGSASLEIKETLKDKFCVEVTNSLEIALKKAFNESKSFDAILLSPGCSSFDQYQNYMERGEHFKSIVREMNQKQKTI